jgi:hypothetical protein
MGSFCRALQSPYQIHSSEVVHSTLKSQVLEELYTPAQHRKQGERRETHIIDHLVHDRSVVYPQPQFEAVRSMQDDGQCNGSIYECEICGL